MNDDLFTPWQTWPEVLDHLAGLAPVERPRRVAERLRERVRGASLAGCRLDGQAEVLGGSVAMLDRVGPLDEARTVALDGAVGLAAPVARRGFLLLGLPDSYPPESRIPLLTLLALAGHSLALALEAERWRSDCAEGAALTVVGEALAGLAPQVSACLNQVAFRAAALQLRVEPSLRASLDELRGEGLRATALLRPLQLLRERSDEIPPRSDLNVCLAEILEGTSTEEWLRLDYSAQRPTVAAHPAAVRRLGLLLLRVALAMPDRQGFLELRTGIENGAVELRVTVPGTTPATRSPDDLPLSAVTGLEEVDRLALLGLIRRLGARLELREPDTTLAVTWPAG